MESYHENAISRYNWKTGKICWIAPKKPLRDTLRPWMLYLLTLVFMAGCTGFVLVQMDAKLSLYQKDQQEVLNSISARQDKIDDFFGIHTGNGAPGHD